MVAVLRQEGKRRDGAHGKFNAKLLKMRGAFDSAENHKCQRSKRQSVTAKREKSQTPKFL